MSPYAEPSRPAVAACSRAPATDPTGDRSCVLVVPLSSPWCSLFFRASPEKTADLPPVRTRFCCVARFFAPPSFTSAVHHPRQVLALKPKDRACLGSSYDAHTRKLAGSGMLNRLSHLDAETSFVRGVYVKAARASPGICERRRPTHVVAPDSGRRSFPERCRPSTQSRLVGRQLHYLRGQVPRLRSSGPLGAGPPCGARCVGPAMRSGPPDPVPAGVLRDSRTKMFSLSA